MLTLKLILIAVGGAAGALLRYAIAGVCQQLAGDGFPLGTLVVNSLGSGVLGFLAAAFAGPWLVPEAYRAGLLIGLLGGFTTFSTYALESFSLANDRQWTLAAANLLFNNAAALLAAWLGYRLAERIYGV